MKHKVISGEWNKYGLWIRFFGYGFTALNASSYQMRFSERYEYTKVYKFAGMVWKFLKP